MLEQIKLALRITHTQLDDDIQSNIDAALLDMSRVGVDISDLNNALLSKCVEFYCKWIYNYQGIGDKFQTAYERLRDSLSQSAEYNGGDNNE